MSKFQNSLDIVIKYWPRTISRDSPLALKIADLLSNSGWSEEEFVDFADIMSDEFDSSFTNGIHAGQQ